jgi:predicted transcriptional regulator
MVQRKRNSGDRSLTAVELELMNIVWELGDCTVKDVQNALPKDRALAYTSVATMMKILEGKGVLESRKNDRAHTYYPLISKAQYEASALRQIANHLFQGDSTSMVMRLLDEADLSQKELEAIRSFLNERIQK